MFGYKIHVNSSRASPIHAHVTGVWQLQIWFTFPIAVTVVLSLRLSSEHAKLSLSSSSARTILSRELYILTARSSRFSDQAEVAHLFNNNISLTGLTSHVDKKLTTTWVRNSFVSEHALPKRAA